MHRVRVITALFLATTAHAGAQPPGTAGSQSSAIARGVARPDQSVPRLLPGTRGNLSSTIRGTALTSTNGSLPGTTVRVRDARFGRIVDTQVTDSTGTFAFTGIEPGSYVVEVMGNDRTVVAASEIISVNARDIATAVVRLPFRVPPFAGVLGNSTSSAAAVTAEAIASGVLATSVAGGEASPTRVF
jgi:hypothetical protein